MLVIESEMAALLEGKPLVLDDFESDRLAVSVADAEVVDVNRALFDCTIELNALSDWRDDRVLSTLVR